LVAATAATFAPARGRIEMKEISRRTFFGQVGVIAGSGVVAPIALSDTAAVPPRPAGPMPLRPFGRTGVQVTAVGVGGGGRFFEPVPSDEMGQALLVEAIDKGVGFIETAANYGPQNDLDMSERRIGLAMKTHRDKVFLETKVDARDYDGAMRSMEHSLELLQTDHLDLVLHHNVSRAADVDRILQQDGAEAAIRRMVDQGVVRFRGFSCHSPELTMETIPRIEPDAIQSPINATRVPDFEAEVLPLAQERGIAVIAMKTCGHGLFKRESIGGMYDTRYFQDQHPEEHRFAPPPEVFDGPHPAADEYTHYVLSLPIATAVVGMDSRETMDAFIRVATTMEPMSAGERDSLHRRAQVLATTGYWIPRPRRGE
jgi:aryl-alcohol dehydrogenase-like predicted oxidoreductase